MTGHIGVDSSSARVLLAAPDTLHFSADIQLSDELHEKLEREKLAAQEADKVNAVHCPDWLDAQVLPHGARGGYGLVLETDDFSVKVLGKGIPNRPGLFVELRSHFLHTHPQGPQAACEEALGWLPATCSTTRTSGLSILSYFSGRPTFTRGSSCGLARGLGASASRRARRLSETIYQAGEGQVACFH